MNPYRVHPRKKCICGHATDQHHRIQRVHTEGPEIVRCTQCGEGSEFRKHNLDQNLLHTIIQSLKK